MIKAAKLFKEVEYPPDFRVVDMREIDNNFEENSFDGAWVSASLIHIPEKGVSKVLSGIRKILRAGGRIYIGLKAGKQGTAAIKGYKYGEETIREFTFWGKENFDQLLQDSGFEIIELTKGESGITGKMPTNWLNYQLMVIQNLIQRKKPPNGGF